jgi:DNA-binding transcriptional LysR family regulator
VTLKQLEAFCWAASCANFALAAERVCVSISSLSKRIAELEVSLGVTLFDRSGQRALLTDAGAALLPRAQAMLRDAAAIRRDVTHDSGIHGTCRFGVGELTALTWLPTLVSNARQRYPDLRLEPSVDAGSSLGALERRVHDGALDFAVIAGRSSSPEMTSVDLGEGKFKWVGAPALVGNAKRVTARLLASTPVITLPPGTGTHRVLDEWLGANNHETPQRLTCNSWGVVAGLLVEGLGIGFLPVAWADQLTARGELRPLGTRHALGPLRYAFYRRRDDTRPLVTAMMEVVRESIDFSVPGRWMRR